MTTNTESEFIACKYTNSIFLLQERACVSEATSYRQDCECCNIRGEPLCSSCAFVALPVTLVLDILECFPRYVYYRCNRTPRAEQQQ